MFASPEIEIDPGLFELRRFGQSVKLEKQPLELLILLVERRGQLVRRDEIAAHLWRNNNVHVDIDQSIHSAMRKIRLALDDDAQTPRFIQTVVGKGYRFVGPVRMVSRRPPSALRRIGAGTAALAAIVAGVALIVTTRPLPHQPRDEARESYLRGRYFADKRTPDALRKSIGYYRSAIHTDPNFALAHAALAETLPEAAALAGDSAVPFFDEAINSARRAIELDPEDGEIRAVYGSLLAFGKWRWQAGRVEVERALVLSPNSAMVHESYADILVATGDIDNALRESARAHQLEPVSLFLSRHFAQFLFLSRRYDRSLREFRRAEELDPRNPVTAKCIDNIYAVQGKSDEAVREHLKFLDREGTAPALVASLRAAQRDGGPTAYWSRVLELPLPGVHRSAWLQAAISARIGRTGDAVRLLDRAVDNHELGPTWLRVDPLFDSIRGTPDYTRLLRRMNLEPH